MHILIIGKILFAFLSCQMCFSHLSCVFVMLVVFCHVSCVFGILVGFLTRWLSFCHVSCVFVMSVAFLTCRQYVEYCYPLLLGVGRRQVKKQVRNAYLGSYAYFYSFRLEFCCQTQFDSITPNLPIWPLYFLWHGIKQLFNPFSWYNCGISHLSLIFSWYTHSPEVYHSKALHNQQTSYLYYIVICL